MAWNIRLSGGTRGIECMGRDRCRVRGDRGLPGSAAEAAQLEPGDVIVEAGGKPVNSCEEVEELLKSRFAGDEAALVRTRRGERTRLTLKLPAAPANVSVERFRLARAGKPWAQHGVPRDYAAAARWLHAAAAKGFAASQSVLGRMYTQTDPPEYDKAMQWLDKAVAQNDAEALNALGQLYRNGKGVAKDERRAFDPQMKAGELGCMVAQYNIGVYYMDGVVVAADFGQALKWLLPVAEKIGPGYRDKTFMAIASICHPGDKTVKKDAAKARRWYGEAARAGHVPAQRIFGQFLRDQKDYGEALTWLRKAAEKGDSAAQNDLGTMHYNGQGVTKSRKDAIAWWIQAYRGGSPTARESLRTLGIEAK